jgi:hypothetical protein
MQFNNTVQNTWRSEGLFHVLPSLALYHNEDILTDDYGIIFSWLFLSIAFEVWTDI